MALTTYQFKSDYPPRCIVHIDGDTSLKAAVVGHLFDEDGCQLKLSWVHNGDVRIAYVAEWRCSTAGDRT